MPLSTGTEFPPSSSLRNVDGVVPLRVYISGPATRDVDGILDFIAAENPSAADKLLACLEHSFALLAQRPFLGPAAGLPRRFRFRRLSIPPYIIFYLPTPTELQIACVLHGARDLSDHSLFEV